MRLINMYCTIILLMFLVDSRVNSDPAGIKLATAGDDLDQVFETEGSERKSKKPKTNQGLTKNKDKPSKIDKDKDKDKDTKKSKEDKEDSKFFSKIGGGFGSGQGTSLLAAAGAGILLGGVMGGAGGKLGWIFAGLVMLGVMVGAVCLYWRVKMIRDMLSCCCGSDDDQAEDYYETDYDDYDSD